MEAGASIDLDILYQGSLYLWYASYFNVKCDNKGTTITLIWSIFGIFSDKPWTSSLGHLCKYDKVFLLFLKSTRSEVKPTKICLNQYKCYYAIFTTIPMVQPFDGFVLATYKLTIMPVKTAINPLILERPMRSHLEELIHFWLA